MQHISPPPPFLQGRIFLGLLIVIFAIVRIIPSKEKLREWRLKKLAKKDPEYAIAHGILLKPEQVRKYHEKQKVMIAKERELEQKRKEKEERRKAWSGENLFNDLHLG